VEQLSQLFSPLDNWKTYRTTLAQTELPVIPFLGLYLQALTFAEDGNPMLLQPHNLINWKRNEIIGQMLKEINKFQTSEYQIEPVFDIQMILQFDEFSECNSKQLHQVSLELEPRWTSTEMERQTEKIKHLKKYFKKKTSSPKKGNPDDRVHKQKHESPHKVSKKEHTKKQKENDDSVSYKKRKSQVTHT